MNIKKIHEAPYKTQKINNELKKNNNWDGKYYQINSPQKLPEVCIKCGSEHHVTNYKKLFSYINPFAFLGLVLGPLGIIMTFLIFRKQVNIEYSICQICQTKRGKYFFLIPLFWTLAAVFLFVLNILNINPNIIAIVVCSFSFSAMLGMTLKDTQLAVRKYKKPHFYLKGISPDAQKRIKVRAIRGWD
jgi:hypothetical protein